MTLRIPNAAEEAFLDLILAEGYTLRLFTNDVESGLTESQKEALTAGSFTEATFPGYASIALTGGSWVTTQADDASTGVYAQQTFTRNTTAAGQTVRGYYVTRTTGGALRWYEYFAGPITVDTNGDTIRVTPTFTLDDSKGATVAARGVIAKQTLSADSTGITGSATTDFALASVATDSSRLYRWNLKTQYLMSAAGLWTVAFFVDGVDTDRMHTIDEPASRRDFIDTSGTWEPTTGSKNLDVRVTKISGAATLTFEGGATIKRQFWIEDVGPR